jgi:predicted AAA+ superfamily ATPase
MLYHLVQALLDQGIDQRRILFITVENPIYNNLSLEKLFRYGREAAGQDQQLKDWYVIFDEIQYLRDWDVHLKSLVESYRDVRFIVSGSAASALKLKSHESGAGRFTDFMLPPLTFYEFITMQGLSHYLQPVEHAYAGENVQLFKAADIRQFNRSFVDYVNFGGYPEALFSPSVRDNPERFIRNDVIDKVLLRDLPALYGISNVQELNSLFTTIAYNTANEFSIETLSVQAACPKNTIKKYLEYLEAAFLIKTVRRVDQSGRRFQRDNFFKIYLTNPSLRAALFSPVQAEEEAMGPLTETAVYAQWMHRISFTPWYARWTQGTQGEVDLVGISKKNLQPLWAVEIKWTDRYVKKPGELKSLLKFCAENGLRQAVVTTTTVHEVREYNGVALNFIPAATYAYTIGARTLNPGDDQEQGPYPAP